MTASEIGDCEMAWHFPCDFRIILLYWQGISEEVAPTTAPCTLLIKPLYWLYFLNLQ